MHRNDNQIFKMNLPGRNDKCPCGSNQKWKKCCKTPTRYHNKQLLEWLKVNDKMSPTDYTAISEAELDDPATTIILRERKQEILAMPAIYDEEGGQVGWSEAGNVGLDDNGPPMMEDDGHVDPIADAAEGVQDGQDLPG